MMSISPSGHKRKAWDLNPHPREGARFSKPARPTISDYLPSQTVDPPGIEPGSPVRRTGVFPLDHQPMFIQWTAGDSNPDCLGANQASSLWTSGPSVLK